MARSPEEQVPITVVEGTRPTVTWALRVRGTDGRLTDYPTTGRTFQMYLKDAPNGAEADPLPVMVVSTDGGVTRLAVTIPAARVAAPASRWYRLDTLEGGERIDTPAFGPFVVVDA